MSIGELVFVWWQDRISSARQAWQRPLIGVVGVLVLNISTAPYSASAASNDDAVIDALLAEQAPAPDWRAYLEQRPQRQTAEPPADAPLEAAVVYWRSAPDTSRPDESTRARLLEACEATPKILPDLLRWLAIDSPEVHERLKAIHNRLAGEKTYDAAQVAELLRDSLMHHSQYFREELVRRAFLPDDVVEPEAVRAMTDFIRMDRSAARRILLEKSSSNDLRERVVALTTLRKNFAAEAGAEESTKWQAELKRVASNDKAPLEARRLALLDFASDKSEETAKWFLSLFRDPSLNITEQYSSRSTPLGDVVAADPDYWIPRIVPLVESKDAIIHANAVTALIHFHIDDARADALRPLLPWLDNPSWAHDSEETLGRLRLIQSVDRVDLPEAVPGLLKVIAKATGPELEGAAEALAHYGTREAIAPLKASLDREQKPYHQRHIIAALIKLGGFRREEIVDALRSYALRLSTPAGHEEVKEAWNADSTNDPQVYVGQEIEAEGLSDDEVSKAVLAAADQLATTNPTAADSMRQFVAKWQTPSVVQAIANRLRTGELTAAWVKELIEARAKLSGSLAEVREVKGSALGVQAGVTADSSLVHAVLQHDDSAAQRALLAVARLGRVELPIPEIASFLTAKNQPLARAAELYLEANDSALAREALWGHFKDQARVLGFPHYKTGDWNGGHYRSELQARGLLMREDGPREIIALLSNVRDAVLLVYDNRLVLRRDDGNGRCQEREVDKKELAPLKEWLERERIDDLPPFDTSTADGVQYEYLHLTRAGGRRVYMNNPPGSNAAPRVEFGDQQYGPDPAIYGELTSRLSALSEIPMKVSYPAFESIPGYRVAHTKEQGEVVGFGIRKGKAVAEIKNSSKNSIEWHALTDDGLATDFSAESSETDRFHSNDSGQAVFPQEGPLKGWKLDAEWQHDDNQEGLWATRTDGKKELIARGIFAHLLICPGGEWLVAAKTFDKKMWSDPSGVVRINLNTKRVFPVDLPPAENFDPLAWVAAHRRVLLYRQRDDPRFLPPRDKPDSNAGPEKPEYYLLDSTTGQHQRVEGEFRPLQRLEGHVLQSTAKSNEFFAVIQEKISESERIAILGKYDTEHFRFTEWMRFPSVWLESWYVYVDEGNRIIWLAVNGDLLRVSLPLSEAITSSTSSR